MKDASHYKQLWAQSLQPHVDESIVTVGVLSRASGMTRLGVGKISPIASAVMGSRDKKSSGGLPPNVLIAVTPTQVHLFNYSQKRSGDVKVKERVDTWRRDDMQVTTESKTTAHRVRIHFRAEDRDIEMEAMKGSGINEEMVSILATLA